jgi:hypothetical protein
MERFFIIDKFNTWYDLHSIVTAKNIPDPEPKTNYVTLDGMNGSLDLSESLTGEITYNDRTISASFWTDYGNRKSREKLLSEMTSALHGKKVKIIEPDDPDHYFYGRITIKNKVNLIPYATYTIEAECEPWRYAVEEIERTKHIGKETTVDFVINNKGVKTVIPTVIVGGQLIIVYNGGTEVKLTNGAYVLSDLKLRQGANVITVKDAQASEITFKYREADL